MTCSDKIAIHELVVLVQRGQSLPQYGRRGYTHSHHAVSERKEYHILCHATRTRVHACTTYSTQVYSPRLCGNIHEVVNQPSLEMTWKEGHIRRTLYRLNSDCATANLQFDLPRISDRH